MTWPHFLVTLVVALALDVALVAVVLGVSLEAPICYARQCFRPAAFEVRALNPNMAIHDDPILLCRLHLDTDERIVDMTKWEVRALRSGVTSRTEQEVMLRWFEDLESGHDGYPFLQVGRCVYCTVCDRRLYQGTIPPGHPVAPPVPSKPQRDLGAEFRSRWGLS